MYLKVFFFIILYLFSHKVWKSAIRYCKTYTQVAGVQIVEEPISTFFSLPAQERSELKLVNWVVILRPSQS